jgi:hypothetical protein
MAKLRAENVKKCVSILKDFIAGSSSGDKQKAILALEQLQKITAGTDTQTPGCLGRPRIDGGSCGKRPSV